MNVNQTTPQQTPRQDVVAGEIMAIIAAAVAMVLQRPHKIIGVEEALKLEIPMFVLNPWSMEGRFQHFGSHKVR